MSPWKRLLRMMMSVSLIGLGFLLYALSYGPCGGGVFTLVPGVALGLAGIVTLLVSLFSAVRAIR